MLSHSQAKTIRATIDDVLRQYSPLDSEKQLVSGRREIAKYYFFPSLLYYVLEAVPGAVLPVSEQSWLKRLVFLGFIVCSLFTSRYPSALAEKIAQDIGLSIREHGMGRAYEGYYEQLLAEVRQNHDVLFCEDPVEVQTYYQGILNLTKRYALIEWPMRYLCAGVDQSAGPRIRHCLRCLMIALNVRNQIRTLNSDYSNDVKSLFVARMRRRDSIEEPEYPYRAFLRDPHSLSIVVYVSRILEKAKRAAPEPGDRLYHYFIDKTRHELRGIEELLRGQAQFPSQVDYGNAQSPYVLPGSYIEFESDFSRDAPNA